MQEANTRFHTCAIFYPISELPKTAFHSNSNIWMNVIPILNNNVPLIQQRSCELSFEERTLDAPSNPKAIEKQSQSGMANDKSHDYWFH